MQDFYHLHPKPTLTKPQKNAAIALMTLGWLPLVLIYILMDKSDDSLTYIFSYAIASNQLMLGVFGILLALKLGYELKKFLRTAHQENYLKAYGKKVESICTKVEDVWSKRTIELDIDGVIVSQTKRCRKKKNGSVPVAYRRFYGLQERDIITVYHNPYQPSDFIIPQVDEKNDSKKIS